MAGFGWITPRSSRDLCLRERAKAKRAHHIIRYEFYIVCSCHFKGYSRGHTCPRCGAKIQFSWVTVENSFSP